MKWGVLIGLRPYDISLKRDGQLLGRASYIPFPILPENPDKRPWPVNSRVLIVTVATNMATNMGTNMGTPYKAEAQAGPEQP
jgi:hypothetical protein